MKDTERILWFAVAWFVLVFTGMAIAKTEYVTDQLVITLRRGKSAEHAIIKTIKTGTPVEILEAEKGEPYVKVRLESGEEGYVLGQYLTDQTPKLVIISRLKKEVGQLQNKLAEVEKKRDQLAGELKDVLREKTGTQEELNSHVAELETELSTTKQELQTLKEEHESLLAKSKRVMEISNERDTLNERNIQLTSEVRFLREEKARLMRSGVIKWFLAGGGVFFFGWLIGKISRRKKQGLTI